MDNELPIGIGVLIGIFIGGFIYIWWVTKDDQEDEFTDF
jgi:hypothetical protein